MVHLIIIFIFFLPLFYSIYLLIHSPGDRNELYRKQIVWYYICVFVPIIICYYIITKTVRGG